MDNAKLDLVKAWWARLDYKVEGSVIGFSTARGICERVAFATKARKTQGGPVHN